MKRQKFIYGIHLNMINSDRFFSGGESNVLSSIHSRLLKKGGENSEDNGGSH